MRSLLALLTAAALLACPSAEAQAAHDESTPSPLTALVTEALQKNPDLQRAQHGVQAAEEVPSQRRSLPDPMFTASLQNVPYSDVALSASPLTGVQLSISQAVPFPGKLKRREAVARAGVAAAERQADLVRALVVLEVKQAYWRLSFAERAVAITQESERALDNLTDAVIARLSVGGVPQQDVLQAEVSHSQLRSTLARRKQEVISARRAVNAAVGRPPETPLGPAELPPRSSKHFGPEVANKAAAQNPALVSVGSETRAPLLTHGNSRTARKKALTPSGSAM